MKKYFLISLILAFTAQINAQSNLVFNQVLTQFVEAGEIYTVPDGKVWKITAFNTSSGLLQIGVGSGGENPPINDIHLPFWLKGGQTINNSSNSGRAIVSILEFNVLPVSADTGSSTSGSFTDDFLNGGGQEAGEDYAQGETLSDNDGNDYETITIGNQTWTTTNLNVSTYRDGTPIPHITDKNEWLNSSIGAYTYMNQEDLGYGKIYNIPAILGVHDTDQSTPNKILAPEGYHIPTMYEWNKLFNIYGGIENAGPYLKSKTTWALQGNNESGLDVKSYGLIRSTCANTSSTCINIGFNSIKTAMTAFATRNIIQTNNNRFQLTAVLFWYRQSVYFYGNSAGGVNNSVVESPNGLCYYDDFRHDVNDNVHGVYVRLIKD